nr:hypothetical protein [Tanacetum cinerariifolium]
MLREWLEAYDGEVNLEFDENLISNEFAIKLCLDYEVKKGKTLVKKELIVPLKGEVYFVKFIINPEEYDSEPGVILGRSLLRLAHGVVDFDNGESFNSRGSRERGIGSQDQLKVCFARRREAYYKGRRRCSERIKGEALKEKDEPGAFIFPIRRAESDNDDEEEYVIKRNSPESTPVLPQNRRTFPFFQIVHRTSGKPHEQTKEKPDHHDLNAQDNTKQCKRCCFHKFTISSCYGKDVAKMLSLGCDGEIDDMLRIRRATRYDKIQKNDLWLLSMFDARHQNGYANVAWVIAKWMKRKVAGTQKESQYCYGQFISKLARKCRVLTEDVVRSLSALIYCRDLDTTTLRDLIDSDENLIPEDPHPGVPRVGIPRPPIASI